MNVCALEQLKKRFTLLMGWREICASEGKTENLTWSSKKMKNHNDNVNLYPDIQAKIAINASAAMTKNNK